MPKLKYSELEEILYSSTQHVEENEDDGFPPSFEFDEEIFRLECEMDECEKVKQMSLEEFFYEIYAREALIHSNLGESVYFLRSNQRWWNEELPAIKKRRETVTEQELQRYKELTKLRSTRGSKL
ncbi:MAG TPA: hypothetical protein PKD79_02910 [Candidatus Doudnabacteria bacterium]|nr:hypothetical protein [Candidatus Doudnabacteria bacterium]